jgi:hypothetical protein
MAGVESRGIGVRSALVSAVSLEPGEIDRLVLNSLGVSDSMVADVIKA